MSKDNRQYHILIIEDNQGDLGIVSELLHEQISDPVIIHAHNFKQATEILSAKPVYFDVILLDLTLPDKAGHQLVTEILTISSCCPVIILSGFIDIEFSIWAIAQGVLDYVVKEDLNAGLLYKSLMYAIERMKINAELIESEKRYSDLFHLSPQPMCLYEQGTFRFTKINKAAIDQYGYSEAEFLQMTLLDLLAADEKKNVADIVLKQKRKLNETYEAKSFVYKKNGERIDVETYSTPILINQVEFTLVVAIDVTEKTQHEHSITKAIIKTQEDERYEIGGELHDNVCQILAAGQMSLGMLRESLTKPGVRFYDQCKEYITMALEEIRNLSHRLAPAFFDESTLEEAFKRLFHTINTANEFAIRMHFDNSFNKKPVSLELQLNLYRILQEQLSNIVKYAKASAIDVDMRAVDNRLRMCVADNGIGFDIDKTTRGIGLSNIQRRVELFSGKLFIETSPGNGTTLITDIPLFCQENK